MAPPYAFFAVEGVDYAGKSTLLANLVEYCKGEGIPLRRFRDNGETQPGQLIRSYILSDNREDIGALGENILFNAMRQLTHRLCVIPALQNSHVVTDRSFLSAYAYQGPNIPEQDYPLFQALTQASNLVMPQLILILDVSPEVAEQRVAGRSETPDWFEQQKDKLAHRRQLYHRLHASKRYPTLLVNADRNEEALLSDVIRILYKRGIF